MVAAKLLEKDDTATTRTIATLTGEMVVTELSKYPEKLQRKLRRDILDLLDDAADKYAAETLI